MYFGKTEEVSPRNRREEKARDAADGNRWIRRSSRFRTSDPFGIGIGRELEIDDYTLAVEIVARKSNAENNIANCTYFVKHRTFVVGIHLSFSFLDLLANLGRNALP
jgi:hypothetical protein